MNRDTEFDRLRETYAAQNDEQLLHAWERRESFTDLAQQAIESVISYRGLSKAAAEMVNSGPDSSSEAAEPAQLDEDEVGLHRFVDMFQLSRALDLLDEAGLSQRVVDLSQREEGAQGFLLVVPRRERTQARELLQSQMGLFPEAEIASADGGPFSTNGFTLLAMFDRKEALVAARALGEAGISYLWRDGKEETNDLPDEETVAIEVHAAQIERATQLVEV